MRSKALTSTFTLALAGLAALSGTFVSVACKVEHEQLLPDGAVGADDAGADGDALSQTTEDTAPGDTSVSNCTLSSSSGVPDPVALCRQKAALIALHGAAFDPKKGVATSWSSQTGLPDTEAGVELHSWQDDVAYAAACALYHANAQPYGDTSFTPTADADLLALAPLIEKDLATLPAEYEGEDYRRLRTTASGLLFINDTTDGMAINALADKYGRQIYSKYFFKVTTVPVMDAGEAEGGEAGPTDAAVADSATPDGGDGGVVPPIADGIIGRPSNGAYAYVTADVATAAVALIDMAYQNPKDPLRASWQQAAQSALQHLHDRARDAATGLYYTALVTSADAGHDAFDTSNPQAATMFSDTTVTVALALARAQALVNKDQANNSALDAGLLLPVIASYPFSQHVDEAIAALNNGVQSLYDGPAMDAGAVSTGFMEGYAPGTATPLISTKTTRANAYALAVLHLQESSVGTTYDREILPETQTLTGPGISLSSITPLQTAFFRAGTRTFGLVNEPNGSSYQTAAITAFVEGMSELLPVQ